MKKFVVRLLFVLSSISVAHAQVPVNINVPLINQQNPEWCWAASAQMILAFLGVPNTQNQCTLVELAHGHPPGTCCLGWTNCTEPGTTQDIQNLIGAAGTMTMLNTSPNLPQMYAILSGQHPIIAHLALPTGGHFVVIRGLTWVQGQPIAIINDPMQPKPILYPLAGLAYIWDMAVYIQ